MKKHTHKFKPSERSGWERCSCGTFHNTVPFDRSDYLGSYWDGVHRSTLEQQRYNLELFINENGESKVRAALKHCVSGSILEVAAAPGSLCRIAQEEGWEVEGVEPEDAYAAEISQHAKCPVHIGFFEDIKFDRTYNNIVALDLLEHLSDPDAFVRKAMGLLEDDGRLILMIPTVECARECDFTTPEHIWIFSEDYLREWLNPLVIEKWLDGHCVVVVEK